MFVLELPETLFKFSVNSPFMAPLSQLPPCIKSSPMVLRHTFKPPAGYFSNFVYLKTPNLVFVAIYIFQCVAFSY